MATGGLSRLIQLKRSLQARYSLSKCDYVGSDARAFGELRVVNEGRITIGDRFRIAGEPVPSHLSAQAGGTIEIGDDVKIGHGSGITAKGLIRIGSGTRLGAFVLAMDTDYHVAGDANATAEIAPLQIGERVTIGNRVTILRGSIIGDGARVLDGSVVRGVVSADEVVDGVPARPVRADTAPSSTGSTEIRLLRLAQTTFRLPVLPQLSDGPAEIEAWDSLGALSFILAMEEEFGQLISEEQMSSVHCLADAAAMVGSASDRR
jgi:acetyltransferase-like isoleucine patch superfamily enzyme